MTENNCWDFRQSRTRFLSAREDRIVHRKFDDTLTRLIETQRNVSLGNRLVLSRAVACQWLCWSHPRLQSVYARRFKAFNVWRLRQAFKEAFKILPVVLKAFRPLVKPSNTATPGFIHTSATVPLFRLMPVAVGILLESLAYIHNISVHAFWTK